MSLSILKANEIKPYYGLKTNIPSFSIVLLKANIINNTEPLTVSLLDDKKIPLERPSNTPNGTIFLGDKV